MVWRSSLLTAFSAPSETVALCEAIAVKSSETEWMVSCLRFRSVMSASVVVGGKFVLRVGREQLRERHGARPKFWF